MGNPIIWWGGSISLIIAAFVSVGLVVRRQRYGGGRGTRKPAPNSLNGDSGRNGAALAPRPGDGLTQREWAQFWHVTRIAGGGWILHYLPFLIMGRVTYIHHYVNISFLFQSTRISNIPSPSFQHYISPYSCSPIFWTTLSSKSLPLLQRAFKSYQHPVYLYPISTVYLKSFAPSGHSPE